MLQTQVNYLSRNLDYLQFQAGNFYHLFQNARRINTQAVRVPFPDGALARTFRDRNLADFWALERALGYPQIMTRYWQVVNVLRGRRMVPFVHGQSAIWSVAQRVLLFLGYRGCQRLRLPGALPLRSSAEIYQRVEAIEQERRSSWNPFSILLPSVFGGRFNNLDHVPEFRDSLLATTIGLFHLERNESPFSFVLGGVYGSPPAYFDLSGNRNILPSQECIQLANRMVVQGLEASNFARDAIGDFLIRINPLYEAASRLHIGQFLVFGVPYDQLPQAVYHSRSFGFPTGNSLEQVIRDFSEGRFEAGGQARIMFSQETLSEESPIEVINIMDRHEVENFCRTLQGRIRVSEEEADLRGLLAHTNPEGEGRVIGQIEDLYARIDRVIREHFG